MNTWGLPYNGVEEFVRKQSVMQHNHDDLSVSGYSSEKASLSFTYLDLGTLYICST